MPNIVLTLPAIRTLGSASLSVIGLSIPALQVTAAVFGGYYVAPFLIPNDLQPSHGSTAVLVIAPSADSVAAGTAVELSVNATLIDPQGVRSEQSFPVVVPIPNPWLSTDRILVSLVNGSGFTFAAGAIDLGYIVGLRAARNGPAAADTWPGALLLAQSLLFLYRQRCISCSGIC